MVRPTKSQLHDILTMLLSDGSPKAMFDITFAWLFSGAAKEARNPLSRCCHSVAFRFVTDFVLQRLLPLLDGVFVKPNARNFPSRSLLVGQDCLYIVLNSEPAVMAVIYGS